MRAVPLLVLLLAAAASAPPLPEPWGPLWANNTSFNNTSEAETVIGTLDNGPLAVLGGGMPFVGGAVILLVLILLMLFSHVAADSAAVIMFPTLITLAYYGFIPQWFYVLPAVIGGYIVARGLLDYMRQ